MNHRRHGEAAQRFADRRQREDEARRLHEELPQLESLRLEIEERRATAGVAEASHIRRIVVESAPALFILTCGDPSCRDGGHDVTHMIMRALQHGDTRFDGEDTCQGSVGTATCGRVLRYVGIATYRGFT